MADRYAYPLKFEMECFRKEKKPQQMKDAQETKQILNSKSLYRNLSQYGRNSIFFRSTTDAIIQ